MACTVLGQESVIQKYLNASAVPLHLVKRRHDSLGNTPCVTYALTQSAPCSPRTQCVVACFTDLLQLLRLTDYTD